jgi:hypothetical protein
MLSGSLREREKGRVEGWTCTELRGTSRACVVCRHSAGCISYLLTYLLAV